MRFIKGILGKCFPVGPYFLQLIFGMALLFGPFYELPLHLVQHRLLLLTHGLAQYVGISLREAAYTLR